MQQAGRRLRSSTIGLLREIKARMKAAAIAPW